MVQNVEEQISGVLSLPAGAGDGVLVDLDFHLAQGVDDQPGRGKGHHRSPAPDLVAQPWQIALEEIDLRKQLANGRLKFGPVLEGIQRGFKRTAGGYQRRAALWH